MTRIPLLRVRFHPRHHTHRTERLGNKARNVERFEYTIPSIPTAPKCPHDQIPEPSPQFPLPRFISPASPKAVTTAGIHTQGVGTGRNRGAEFMHCNALCCLLLTTACLAVAYSNHLLMVVTECSCIAQISAFTLCVIHGE